LQTITPLIEIKHFRHLVRQAYLLISYSTKLGYIYK